MQELRFLVTQRCTNQCFFCHAEGLQSQKTDMMSADDIEFVFETAKLHFGCETATLTGGEPLLRKDIMDIASKLHRNHGKVTLTTNGVLLEENMFIGNYLERLNISIHSVDSNVYQRITKRNVFHRVVYGMEQFRRKYPDVEIRLNATLLRGFNTSEDDFDDLLQFAAKLNASVKFVELYPNTSPGAVTVGEAEGYLRRRGFKPTVSTTRKRNYSNGFLEVGLTKIFCAEALEHENPAEYCSANNDLFISPDGRIKPCRHIPEEIDILLETQDRDSDGVYKKLRLAFETLGEGCLKERVA